MNSEKLSQRLEKVSHYVLEGSVLADIGSDHAYLPCHLGLKGKIKKGIAGEITEGPYLSAKEQVELDGLSEIIEVRKGDGLSVLKENEAEVITICGMGGSLITSILESGKEKLGSAKRLVLQPNIGAQNVRKWLLNENWVLSAEEILKEDGKIYEVLVADKSGEQPYTSNTEAELLFGPFLLKSQNDAFKEKWAGEVKQWKAILTQMERSQGIVADQKRKELVKHINLAEEWID
ncbi:tRNA (adenine(22)-N(1))-methyltransferase [Fictibacillus phosphorivorans]|uniref:tRNA (adenine(22)-N(1))-methyltransferase n=1 Tax=Fictibacillus phosphorivorans TaxID=1221500 RepID=UPI00203E4730|nr:tRNA (adenine(22)-N(1))-methyltransferase TrmK [Fictibacillus phosphorivorans]MCM3716851.1 tRNA (adenine(22)-N(1))-methyltransferase TrmK [Fictibacillus phosphorivorans]MCM3774600.1 tRNA (adenine(22)-N(1))-methyltransferase TrmK [Fictibacillus phosphorivorans]